MRLTTACAGVEHLLGRHDQAHARLVSAMESLQDPASLAAAELMIALAMDGFHLMDYPRMCEWAERALTTAQGIDDRPLAAAAAAVLAFANAANGAIAVAETRCSQAAALVADLSDDQLAIRLDAAVHLAGAELYLDRFRRRRPTPSERWRLAWRQVKANWSRSPTQFSVRSRCCAGG